MKPDDLHSTCKVAIMSHSGKYVTAWPNGTVNCMSTEISSFEIWTITFVDTNRVTLKSSHQKYLRAQITSTTEAKRDEAGNCEMFKINTLEDGKFAFKSYFGTNLKVEDGTMSFNSPYVGDKEKFSVFSQTNTNTESQEETSPPSTGSDDFTLVYSSLF